MVGAISTTASLPNPKNVDRDAGYFIKNTDELAFLVESNGSLIWETVPYRNGTVCYVDGNVVNELNMSNYVKHHNNLNYNSTIAYVRYTNGTDAVQQVQGQNSTQAPPISAIATYFGGQSPTPSATLLEGRHLITGYPNRGQHCANKTYVDTKINDQWQTMYTDYLSKIEPNTHCYAADQTNTPNSIYTGLMNAVESAGTAMWKIPISRLYARESTEEPFHLYYSSGGTLLLIVSASQYQADDQNQCEW
jgi:hypothetical protein